MTGGTSVFLVWGRHVDQCDTLEEAFRRAWGIYEYSDDDWVDVVEAVTNGESTVYDRNHPEWTAAFRRFDDEVQAANAARPPRRHVANVVVVAPGERGSRHVLASFYEPDGVVEAERAAAAIRPALGDRVVVELVR